MKKQNVRTLALIVCTFTYLLIGAALFDALESKNELDERHSLNQTEWELRSMYNMTDEHYELLRRTIIKSRTYKPGTQWKFAGSFYFALSVITTIGYGHSTPRTTKGKYFCIFYALLGIPLNIVMFQSIGERFNMGITFVFKKVKKCFKLRAQVTQTELTVLGGILCGCVLVGGATAFHYFEGWEFADAFYFCFITMSTIGFGDYVALQNETMAALQTRPEYVAFSILYILFGLTVFAAALNLMVLRLLTMNTEDERKDELEAIAASKCAPKLDGDVIRLNGNATTFEESDPHEGLVIGLHETSVPSQNGEINLAKLCSCFRFKRPQRLKMNEPQHNNHQTSKPRYTVKRMPTNISHLAMQCHEPLINRSSYYNLGSTPGSPISSLANGVRSTKDTSMHDPELGQVNHSGNDSIQLLAPNSIENLDDIDFNFNRKRYSC